MAAGTPSPRPSSRDLNDYADIENLTLLGIGQHQRDRQQMGEHADRQRRRQHPRRRSGRRHPHGRPGQRHLCAARGDQRHHRRHRRHRHHHLDHQPRPAQLHRHREPDADLLGLCQCDRQRRGQRADRQCRQATRCWGWAATIPSTAWTATTSSMAATARTASTGAWATTPMCSATAFDTVIDDGGWDTITSTISRDLNDYPDIENLTLLGIANINATGNAWSNVLIGNDGDNILDGGPGADTLQGGLGNDTYVLLGATNDTIYDIGGIDTITSTISRDLRNYAGIENLTLTFSAWVDATGDEFANVLTGNCGPEHPQWPRRRRHPLRHGRQRHPLRRQRQRHPRRRRRQRHAQRRAWATIPMCSATASTPSSTPAAGTPSPRPSAATSTTTRHREPDAAGPRQHQRHRQCLVATR